MKKLFSMLFVLVLASVMVTGCAGGVSEDKPIAEVKEEARTMDMNQLEKMVADYQKAIEGKKADLQKLQENLKQIPVTEMMGEEAGAIKEDITAVMDSIKALTERMQVYAAELSAKK